MPRGRRGRGVTGGLSAGRRLVVPQQPLDHRRGAAIALAIAWRRIAILTLPLALFAAFSRVFVGVHYPHDVAVGLLLGGLVATLVVLALTRPARALIETMRTSRTGVVVWFAGPGPAAGPTTGAVSGHGSGHGSGPGWESEHGPGQGPEHGPGAGSRRLRRQRGRHSARS